MFPSLPKQFSRLFVLFGLLAASHFWPDQLSAQTALSTTSFGCSLGMTATGTCVSGDYATFGTSSTNYWQYTVNTTGYGAIQMSFNNSSSSTGPNTAMVYYNNGSGLTYSGSNWYPVAATGGGCTVATVNLPSACDNISGLIVRSVMSGGSGGSGTNRVNSSGGFTGIGLITGTTTLCTGSTTSLSSVTGAGTWSSSTTSVATVAAGTVHAVSAGTSTISYTVAGRSVTTVVTVSAGPAAITGTDTVCAGSTTTLSDAVGGGTWSSSVITVATVGTSSGVVYGVTSGTSIITYSTGVGCYITTTVTVNSSTTAITGTTGVCTGSTTTLNDATSGGSWSSSSTGVATIGSSSGIVSGVTAGTSIITYLLGTGCFATAVVTVNPLPVAITGADSVCVGSTTTLSDPSGSGTWASGSTSTATVVTGTGVVTGVATGTAAITFALATGCTVTTSVTVNPLPLAITGTMSVCVGLTSTLNDATTGGTWSSSNSNVDIGSATGIVTGVTAGTTIITYMLGTGCIATAILTVNPLPSVITGLTTVCTGAISTLSDAMGGGTWLSTDPGVATIGSSTGVVTGVASGTSVITYTLGTGCTITTTLTVNPLPASITGTASVCAGLTTTLSDATASGTWSSSSTGVATAGSSSGIVTGVTAGTSVISYTISTGCYTTTTVTVYPLPSPITGVTTVCAGSTTTLSDATTGGTWSSGNTAVATAGSATGVITGVAAGTSVITYTLGTGCIAVTTVSVNPLPAVITGTMTVCEGLTTTLSDATGGGTWTSSNMTVATVGSGTGIVTGVLAGTTIISYTIATGCMAVATVTVNPTPFPITGITSICVGSSTSLFDAGGGTWSSSNTSVASIGSSTGIVAGVATGTANITYTLPTGCLITTVVTIYPLPAAITGTTSICIGLTTTLGDATAGGTWTSSNTTVATIGSSGIVSAVTAGTSVISYTLSTGCFSTATVTINPLPSAITGTTSVCVGGTTILSDAIGGGTWTSSNMSVATAGSASGIITGVSAGTSVITYALGTGCVAFTTLTVNPLPAAITGVTSLCAGLTTALSDATGSGTWSSSNLTVATVVAGTGLVTGVAAGTAIITYTIGTGCMAFAAVTVNPLPSPITGITAICVGSSSILFDAGGGTWSSSNTSVASIGSSTGIVSGIATGTSNITYTLPTGCLITTVVTIYPLPGAIAGTSSVCVGSATTLSDPIPGGSWSSSNGNVSIGSSTGTVTGIAAGTSAITYMLSTGCITTITFTVNVLPPAITGPSAVCIGATIALSDPITGGTWLSSNTSVATVVVGTGVVTGVALGTATITYTLPTGCDTVATVTVSPTPTAITGSSTVCEGAVTPLSNIIAGGSWTSSNTSVATVGFTSGDVTGVSAGTTVITYSLGSGCTAVKTITVLPLPSSVSGLTSLCAGSTITLGSSSTGGTWSSSSTTVATVGLSTGMVSGVSSGTTTITYMLGTGCMTTFDVTVNPTPPAISGITSVCVAATTALSNTLGGGTWSSSNTLVAIAGLGTGTVLGVAAGTAIISYVLGTGCLATTVVTVSPIPASISGGASVCAGSTIALTDVVTGGTWSSSNTGAATVVSGTGVVSGVSLGTTVITYMLSGGCYVTKTVTVNTSPSFITGPASVCVGSTITLGNTVTGGTWTSSNTAVATAGISSGIITGVSSGTSIISYSLGAGCIVTKTITVSPSPAVITGGTSICAGATVTLGNTVAGGAWSSSNSGVATVGSGSGIVGGVVLGTAVISYTLPGGCYATTTITVNTSPAAITGAAGVCTGSTIILGNTVGGGTWASSNTSVATAGSTSGIISGVTAGTTVITYSLGAGCLVTRTITVNPLSPITGSTILCAGLTTTLSDATTGGGWSSSNTTVATVVAGTGLVGALSAGTTIISYLLPTGCLATATLTVIALPTAITGTLQVCAGATTALSNAVSGGTWTSSSMVVATVGSSTGIVTGVSAGTSAITYSRGVGCSAAAVVTVNPLPAAVSGGTNICIGTAITWSSATGGGTWSSSNTTVASVGPATGIISGVSAGTAVVSYLLGTGCYTSATVTVNPLPSAITGGALICAGQTTALSNILVGGTWSSSNTAIATAGSVTGIVTGVSAGTAFVTYTLGTGCIATVAVTVMPVPAAITGPANVCAGASITLSDATAGGNWSSSNSAIASIGSGTGIVSGIASGTVAIYYTLSSGCGTLTAVIVNPVAPITGPTFVCVGQIAVLSDTVLGGAWTSGSTSVATIVAGSGSAGIVHGVATGVAIISYALPTGCLITYAVSVNPIPAPITGTTSVCAGLTTALYSGSAGGIWSSGNTAIASIGTGTGVVTGIAAGISIISYAIGGCPATTVVTVNPLPGIITGSTDVCAGSTITYTNSTPFGSWSSSNTSVATIDPATGALTGVATGTSTVTYTLGTGCVATSVVTVNPLPLPITGSINICLYGTTTLSDATAGGTWSSGDLSVATIDATGVASGVHTGTTTITYMLGTGCFITAPVTVLSLPPAITGLGEVCAGSTITLTDAVTGGTWATGPGTVATVGSSTGIVTGVAAGIATVTYTAGTGCYATTPVTVNPLPLPITGITSLCVTSTTALYDLTPGGAWSSSQPGVASIDASGAVTGITAGTAIISYDPGTGCVATTTVYVSPFPSPIHGNMGVCLGSVNVLTDTVAGGSWYSTNTAVAAAGSVTGAITGVSPGTSVIVYTLGSGCTVTTIVTVKPLPAVYTITGGGNFCAGGAGVHIGLTGSQTATNYLLYTGSTPTGTFAGTGASLDFGLQTAPGTYRVVAISTATTCSSTMTGTVSIVVNPAVTPSVDILAGLGDTTCAGATNNFRAIATYGGIAPAYTWQVNGTSVGLGSTYSYVPANGDVVTVSMVSDTSCAVPAVVSHSVTMNVVAHHAPLVTLSSSPGDTVCTQMAVTLVPNPVYGGGSPVFMWIKNHAFIGTGPSYSYIPANGDVVYCKMISNYFCRTVDTVPSNLLSITVVTPVMPTVDLNADPGSVIGASDRTVTFTAIVSNAGDAPTYQWLVNGVPVAGATSATFTHSHFSTFIPDSISCEVTSSGVCPMTTHNWVFIEVNSLGVTPVAAGSGISVIPNPNKGIFTVRGSSGNVNDEEITLEITDMLGQVVYAGKAMTKNGRINESVQLDSRLANGMYLLNLHLNSENKVFHLVVER